MEIGDHASVRPHPFDTVAIDYDAGFTHTRLGRWLRETAWEHLGNSFQPGDHVLELGCGTGEDAIWLAERGVRVTATDASREMLKMASRRSTDAGLNNRVTFAQLDLAELGGRSNFQSRAPKYDGVFSNFGALNCVPDRRSVAEALSRWVKPGGKVVMVVMGPFCPWEIGWHLMHGSPRTAFRRFRSGVKARVGDEMVRVWYPSPGRLRSEFAPHFGHLETVGIGALLPPTCLSHLVDRWPRLFERAAVLDRRLGSLFPWTWLNDHYLTVFEQK